MTSFASTFGSSDEGQNYPNNNGINSTKNTDDQQGSNNFSSVDLDQQLILNKEHQSPYVSLSDAATFQTELSSMAGIVTNNPSRNLPFSSQDRLSNQSFSSNTIKNTSSVPTDRRISIPDMSRLSASSAAAVASVGPTIDKLKQWSRSTYKCTKQSIYEKLGKTTRTVDVEVDTQIEQLRETKRRYENMLALARSYANHFLSLMQTQRVLCDQFLELKQKSFLLCDEFHYNAETQRVLVRNGEILLNALHYFISTLNTLCTKTIEDTMTTIRLYEAARLEYDACRTEMELLSPGSQMNEKQDEFQKYKDKYEQLKCDVSIKLKFLDENQTKVMKKQLLLFHNAIAAYFSGNKEALDATMKQFNLKVNSNDDNDQDRKSFLEQLNH
ncbi:unnamed protein product [Rotaria sordida]|uniref:AH domain-containing protein n=2 Tax=Rotaria sordida TaxID=392033 RepID=A0A818V1T3_9BILA|nr:unnamed protein product [Rotaria sordida]CAF3496120.1 unnamed protein product [Rotaria sordida]CAF3706166.1 unnamed protein product [Rotaria sordida]